MTANGYIFGCDVGRLFFVGSTVTKTLLPRQSLFLCSFLLKWKTSIESFLDSNEHQKWKHKNNRKQEENRNKTKQRKKKERSLIET